jgi:hypothetical protein
VFLLSPKSCANAWSDSGDRELDLGELTGADPSWVFARVNIWVSSLLSTIAAIFSLD